jgi:DinB superfamily
MTFDFVLARLGARLDGLDDHEYLWEPVRGCWSLRLGDDGRWRLDGDGGGGPPPNPVPFTTIAWQIGHLGAICLGGFAGAIGDGELWPSPDSFEFSPDASGARAFLDSNSAAWRGGIATWVEEAWNAQLGSKFGPYAQSTRTDLALHVLDAVVHHAAEVALLRDLFVHRSELGFG